MAENTFRPLTYVLGNTTLRVEYSDITALGVDVLVSSDDTNLSMGGGVSEALLRMGGQEVWRESRKWVPVGLGNIAITTAGHLKAKQIFHAAVLDRRKPYLTTIDLIRKVTKKCLSVCNELGFGSIAFPALATGAAGLSPERSAVAMLLEMATHFNQSTSINSITIALYPRPGLPRNVLPNFYAQVTDFLEIIQRMDSMTKALDNLEGIYRALNLNTAAESTAFSREDIQRHREIWEREILEREPGDIRHENIWNEYRREIEPDLRRLTSLSKRKEELDEIVAQHGEIPNLEKLEREYKEHRGATLRAMIIHRKKNITDFELQKTIRGFSVEINRQIEYEQQEISRLETELQELK
jgi:O-acetyl-ADP-ribose deacetylase (regulator of RNase III)